jgi:hypothetical protein
MLHLRDIEKVNKLNSLHSIPRKNQVSDKEIEE